MKSCPPAAVHVFEQSLASVRSIPDIHISEWPPEPLLRFELWTVHHRILVCWGFFEHNEKYEGASFSVYKALSTTWKPSWTRISAQTFVLAHWQFLYIKELCM